MLLSSGDAQGWDPGSAKPAASLCGSTICRPGGGPPPPYWPAPVRPRTANCPSTAAGTSTGASAIQSACTVRGGGRPLPGLARLSQAHLLTRPREVWRRPKWRVHRRRPAFPPHPIWNAAGVKKSVEALSSEAAPEERLKRTHEVRIGHQCSRGTSLRAAHSRFSPGPTRNGAGTAAGAPAG